MASSGTAWDDQKTVAQWRKLGEMGIEAGLREFGFSEEIIATMVRLDQQEALPVSEIARYKCLKTDDEQAALYALFGRGPSSCKTLYVFHQNPSRIACALYSNLSSNTNVENLIITGSPSFQTVLGAVLRTNSALQDLSLVNFQWCTESVKCLADGINASKTLLSLGLQVCSGPDVREGNISSSIEAMAWMMRTSKTLATLKLWDADLLPEYWSDQIFPALKESEALQSISLEFCKGFTGKDVSLILKEKKRLSILRLVGAEIEPEDWEHQVFPALSDNDTLQELDLSFSTGLLGKEVDLLRSIGTGSTRIVLRNSDIAFLQRQVDQVLKMNTEFRAGLRHEIMVPATSGRLVLCGYGFAGKTTIRSTMERLEHEAREFSSVGQRTRRRMSSGIRRHLIGKTELARTRGFDILLIENQPFLKSVWDFAGQREYYALHDYVFPNIRNSCFLFVCSCRHPAYSKHKKGAIKDQEIIRKECEYWMRFIASNSKPVQIGNDDRRLLPRVRFVLTGKDTLKSPELHKSRQKANLVVRELKLMFKDVVELCETVEVVNSHFPEDVKRLLELTNDSLKEILEEQKEYDICTKVRNELDDMSTINPVMSVNDFYSLPTFSNAGTRMPVREAVLGYLNFVGEVIHPTGFDFLVANPRWFGVRVLGSLIDAFRGAQDQAGVLGPRYQSLELVHDKGYVHRKDLLEHIQTIDVERTISPDKLIQLMIHLELCFEIKDPKNGDSSLFMPALFDDDKESAAEGKRKLEWKLKQYGNLYFLGRRLECEKKATTFLTPGFFPRLQVHMRNYLHQKGWTENPGFAVDRNLICFAQSGIEILVEYSGDKGYFVDILVRSSDPYAATLQFLGEHVVKIIQSFCDSPQGCPGVGLVEGVIRPVCVEELHLRVIREDHSVLVSELKDRLRENKGFKHIWRRSIEGEKDTDFALDLLEGHGAYERLQGIEVLVPTVSKPSSSEQFPRLFFPSIEDVGLLTRLNARLNPARKMPVKLHLLCDHKDDSHKVIDQPGRTVTLDLKAGKFDMSVMKLAVTLLWSAVGIGASVAGASVSSQLVDDWVQNLFKVPNLPDIDGETLQQLMDRGKSPGDFSNDKILKALEKYWEIDPSTQGLIHILNLQDYKAFWDDFRLRKVVYTVAPHQDEIGWVCQAHYASGLQQRILMSAQL